MAQVGIDHDKTIRRNDIKSAIVSGLECCLEAL